MSASPKWEAIEPLCPEPLPDSIPELDALVLKHRPELPHESANSKKRKSWRQNFVGKIKTLRWRRDNPKATCFDCKHLDYYAEHDLRCGLGYESGGWYTPVKPDGWCPSFEEAPNA